MIEPQSFLNAKGELLSGILNNGRAQSPILMLLHGFASNKDQDLLLEAESFFAVHKYNVFRYDVAGAGESQGDFLESSIASQITDLQSAIEHLSTQYNNNNISIIGFSLGAAVAAIHNNPRIANYVFWSPALFPAIDMYPRYATTEIQSELISRGYIEKEGLKVGKQIIEDLGSTHLEHKLAELKRPVLMIHGTDDPRINYQNTIQAHSLIPNSEVHLISGANHSYKNNHPHRQELFEKTHSWLQQHKPKKIE
ncbi:lysophospholipase [Candidatus Woesearchaeota archaeon]|nr:lysophospholipase [Candidatus Woesearchaeota archaeon]